jgi:hypothetical protein
VADKEDGFTHALEVFDICQEVFDPCGVSTEVGSSKMIKSALGS